MNKLITAIVFAGGKGTRMGEGLPKPMRLLNGKPIIYWTLDTLLKAGIKNIYVLVGHQSELVKKIIKNGGYKVKFIKQINLLGTGHAAKFALTKIGKSSSNVLIMYADDSALYSTKTINDLVNTHITHKNKGTLLVLDKFEPTNIGGLKFDNLGHLTGVLTKSDMELNGIKKHMVLCGAMCFNRRWLSKNIGKINKNPKSGEYPLPAIIKIAALKKEYLDTVVLSSQNEWSSINTPEELAIAEKLKN